MFYNGNNDFGVTLNTKKENEEVILYRTEKIEEHLKIYITKCYRKEKIYTGSKEFKKRLMR